MIKNFFMVALRNLGKNKSYVLINTLGMGIALACCMAAYLLIAYDIEFDNTLSHDKTRNLVKVMHHLEQPNGEPYKLLVAPIVMAPVAAQEVAGIQQYMRYVSEGGFMTYEDNTFSENVYFADRNIFDLFGLELVKGSPKEFEQEYSIYISERLAEKYFGKENPMDKVLSIEFRDKPIDVTVAGVLKKVPLNSSFIPDALMRIENYIRFKDIQPDAWGDPQQASVIFQLSDAGQKETVSGQLNQYISRINLARTDSRSVSFELIPFDEGVSPNDVQQSYLHLPIPAKALVIFSILGAIILLVACFNLTNTTMALTIKRMKEIGVRKVVGSSRGQIVYQFLLEIALIIGLSIISGLLISQLVVPEFTAMWGLQYGLSDLNGANFLAGMIIILFVCSILVGSYPALFNSKQNPLLLFKGGKKSYGTTPMSKVLLVCQFSLSVIVLIGGVIFIQNAAYQQTISFGYDKERLLIVSLDGQQEFERLRDEIQKNASVEGIAGVDNYFGDFKSFQNPVRIDTGSYLTNVYRIGANYFNVAGMDVLQGRDFAADNAADVASSAIVDENFVKRHQLKEAVGTTIYSNGKPYSIVGVVKNHLDGLLDKRSLDQDHVYFMASPSQYHAMVVRTEPGSILGVQSAIQNEWKKLFAGKPFQSELQDDIIFRGVNEYNRNLKRIFLFLTVMGSLLSLSGIYSLAILNVQRRVKEIGIRKVLGASVDNIVFLMNRQYAIILGIAAVVGGAGGFVLTSSLLKDLYVLHIDVGVLTAVACAVVIFVVGISVTSGSILKAARANPGDTLKDE